MPQRSLASLFAIALTMCAAAVASAQTVSGTIPRTETQQTWQRPDGGCSGTTSISPTTRRFQLAFVTVNGPGNYTLTASRSDGGFIAIDVYGPPAGVLPGNECANRFHLNSISGSGSASFAQSCSGSICSSGDFRMEVVISVGAADSVPVSLTVSGGPAVTFGCPSSSSPSLTPSSQTIASGGASHSTVYNFGSGVGCSPAWTATGIPAWVTGIPASGTGGQTINYTASANSTGSSRSATITFTSPNSNFPTFPNTRTLSLTQPAAPSCTYAFSPTSETIPATAGSDSFSMTAGSGCAWTTSESVSWISGVTASGSGNGTISYNYSANTGPARSGTITSQGQTYTANQANGCTVSLTPATTSPGAGATTGSVTVDVSDPACQWTLASNQAFVSGLSASSGTGDATVTYNVAANTGLSRSATLTGSIVGNGNTDTQVITQANGCTVSFSPTTSSPSAAGATNLTTTLTTGNNCAWTLGSSNAFVSDFATSGTGSATISYDVAANTGPARGATLTALVTSNAATGTHTVNQATGCTAMVTPNTINADGSAQTESVTLTMSNGACPFTTSTTGGFITPTPSSGNGSQSIGLALTANTGAARSGTATIAGQVVTVNQASSCTINVTAATASVGAGAGSGSFDIAAPVGCAWTVSSSAGFLSGFTASGSGSANVPYSYSANPGLVRSGTLTATLTSTGVSDTHVVDQANGCTASVSPTTINADGSAHSENVTVTMSDNACPFTTSSGDAWITPGAGGTGSQTVALALAQNTGAARSGTATIAGETVTVNQASVCTVSVDPTANVGAAMGSGSFALTTQAGCGWTLASSAGFVTGFSASGAGPATIDYDYAANVSVGRSAALTVTLAATSATAVHAVNQASGCTASLSASTDTPSEAAGSGSFDITLSDSACPWAASSDAGWLTLPTANGTGDATVDYDYEANIGPERVGTITVLGETFEVTQASGCVVSVSASQAVGTAAGTGTVAVDTETGCTWTASSATPWLSNVTASGTGDGTLSFDYAENVGADRIGTISVASSTTASTDSHEIVQGNGCVAMLDSAADSFGAGAATGSVMLTVSAADCAWNASSSDGWLVVDEGSTSGTGSASIGFSVMDNVSVPRTATLTIAGQTFTVDQASGCVIALTPATGNADAAGGTLMFDLATDAACAWTAAESIDWISGLTASGTGPATIALTADANVGPMRMGDVVFTATEGGATATYSATQSDGCEGTLSSETLAAGAEATAGMFDLTLSSQACTWSTTADAFITVTNGSGTGDATIMLDVAANVGPARTGTVVVAGETFTVMQANGCAVVLAPDSASEESAAGTTQFELQTATGCTWTLATESEWITGLAETGTSLDTIDVEFDENTGIERVGTIEVTVSSGATATFELTQGDGCAITLPVDEADAPAAGGTSSFAVMTGEGCDFEIEADASWLEASQTDTGVEYEVAAWDGAARTGTIEVTSTTSDSSATFTVTQASGCALMLTPGDVSVSADATEVSFDVTTGSGCTITATTDSDFISNIEIEEGTVTADIADNDGDERMGTIEVMAGESMGEFVVQQDAAEDVEPDGGVGDGGITIPDGGITILDGGFDFDDLEVGGGCSCSVAGQERSLPNGLGALLAGLVLAWRVQRRRKR